MDIGWVKTANHLTVVRDGIPLSIKKGSERYSRALKFINKNDKEGLINYLFPIKKIEQSGIKIKEVAPVISEKVITFIDQNLPMSALKKFQENIDKNPSKDSVSQLFEYLKHNHFPIMSDGCFLAYKYVTEEGGNLVDSYTGRFNNNVGNIVVMDRTKCNPDRNVTCSSGLHVAAYEYARNFGGGKVMIEVKVNPKDVVSVPCDYANQKMRVCRYEVLRRGEREIKYHFINLRKKDLVVKSDQKTDPSFFTLLESMTGAQIIEHVYTVTGERINMSPKSKKSVLKKAYGLLARTVNLRTLSGSEIIDFVLRVTGRKIPISPKSKKSVLKYAEKLLEVAPKIVSQDKIVLGKLSGSQMIDTVYEQTGVRITLSPKSKKAIMKKARIILNEHGLKVKL